MGARDSCSGCGDKSVLPLAVEETFPAPWMASSSEFDLCMFQHKILPLEVGLGATAVGFVSVKDPRKSVFPLHCCSPFPPWLSSPSLLQRECEEIHISQKQHPFNTWSVTAFSRARVPESLLGSLEESSPHPHTHTLFLDLLGLQWASMEFGLEGEDAAECGERKPTVSYLST